jgi:ABC-type transporter Mla subunit MlaD
LLTGGSNSARRLGPGESVRSQEAVGTDQIAGRLATLADSANDVMTLLKHELPGVTGEARAALANVREISGTKNQRQIESILAELNTMLRRESPNIAHITERITSLTGHAEDVVLSFKPLLANVDRTVTNVSATVDAVREPLTKDLAELQRTLEDARALIDSVQRVVGDNDDDIHQTVRSLRTAAENVRLLTETLKERPWNLIRTTQPPDRKVPR